MTQIAEIELLGCENSTYLTSLTAKINIQVKNENKSDLKVIPNPVGIDRHVNILLPTELHKSTLDVRIYDVTGKMVYIRTIKNSLKSDILPLQLDQNLPPGIYILTVLGKNEIYHKKIVLE